MDSIDCKHFSSVVQIGTGFDPDHIDLEIKMDDMGKIMKLADMFLCSINVLEILIFKQTYVHTEVPSHWEIWYLHICSDDIGNAHFHQGSLHGILHHPQRNHRKNF